MRREQITNERRRKRRARDEGERKGARSPQRETDAAGWGSGLRQKIPCHLPKGRLISPTSSDAVRYCVFGESQTNGGVSVEITIITDAQYGNANSVMECNKDRCIII